MRRHGQPALVVNGSDGPLGAAAGRDVALHEQGEAVGAAHLATDYDPGPPAGQRLLGIVNQRLVVEAARVYLAVAWLPIALKEAAS